MYIVHVRVYVESWNIFTHKCPPLARWSFYYITCKKKEKIKRASKGWNRKPEIHRYRNKEKQTTILLWQTQIRSKRSGRHRTPKHITWTSKTHIILYSISYEQKGRIKKRFFIYNSRAYTIRRYGADVQ